jgi:hypothetical protein
LSLRTWRHTQSGGGVLVSSRNTSNSTTLLKTEQKSWSGCEGWAMSADTYLARFQRHALGPVGRDGIRLPSPSLQPSAAARQNARARAP